VHPQNLGGLVGAVVVSRLNKHPDAPRILAVVVAALLAVCLLTAGLVFVIRPSMMRGHYHERTESERAIASASFSKKRCTKLVEQLSRDTLTVWRCPDGKGGQVVVVQGYQSIAVTR
jgi:hypothetical protein